MDQEIKNQFALINEKLDILEYKIDKLVRVKIQEVYCDNYNK